MFLYNVARAILQFVNTDKTGGHFVKVAPQSDHNALGVVGVILDEIGHTGAVFDVERSIDFVHYLEWTGLQSVQSKYKCKTSKSLFPSREISNFVPRFIRRPHVVSETSFKGVALTLALDVSHAPLRQECLDFFEFHSD